MTVCYWCGAKDTLADIGKELDDGKYKMVQCSKCKNAYYVVNKEKINKPKPQTNEEYLRSCNTEELANWLLGFAFNFCFTMNDEEDKKNAIRYLKEIHE